MFLGYNTNGFAHHRLEDVIDLIAESGYAGIALTLDVHHLDPFNTEDYPAISSMVIDDLREHHLECVIETGARFLLDARHKHQPTLVSPAIESRQRRFAFLERCIGIASDLGSKVVSFWSGTAADDAPPSTLMNRLVEGCQRLADAAARKGIRLAFEPEPGMFIDTMDKFAELYARVKHPAFGLTVDVGHLVCNGELPVSKSLTQWEHVLWNVHIEDMARGVHDHRMFGEGEVDFADVFAGLRAAEYSGGVYVELSRHSFDAVNTARKARSFLAPYVAGPQH